MVSSSVLAFRFQHWAPILSPFNDELCVIWMSPPIKSFLSQSFYVRMPLHKNRSQTRTFLRPEITDELYHIHVFRALKGKLLLHALMWTVYNVHVYQDILLTFWYLSSDDPYQMFSFKHYPASWFAVRNCGPYVSWDLQPLYCVTSATSRGNFLGSWGSHQSRNWINKMKSHLASWILERLSFVGFWLAGWFMVFSLQGLTFVIWPYLKSNAQIN